MHKRRFYSAPGSFPADECRRYLSEGRFPQEVGTAGPAPLSSDDLTEEKKTDWINIVMARPCGEDDVSGFTVAAGKLYP